MREQDHFFWRWSKYGEARVVVAKGRKRGVGQLSHSDDGIRAVMATVYIDSIRWACYPRCDSTNEARDAGRSEGSTPSKDPRLAGSKNTFQFHIQSPERVNNSPDYTGNFAEPQYLGGFFGIPFVAVTSSNNALQPTAQPLRGFASAELHR